MLGLFKKFGRDEGPLTNLKTVSRWMQELPVGDVYSAQEMVVQNLLQFNHQEKAYNKERLQVLIQLDEGTREMQNSLCLQYLRNARMSKSIETRLWTTIHAFYWEITRGYHSFVMDFVANPGGSRIQSLVPLITARALRGFADIIKWRYYRHARIDDKLWQRLHNLYRIAEFDNFANTPVQLYKDETQTRSLAEEYGRTLLLSPFADSNLTAKEIEMIDQWLGNWCRDIRLESVFDPARHAFYVDTSKGTGIRRCRNQITEPSLRFISTETLRSHLNAARDALKNGATPVSLGLTEDFRLPAGYTLLNLAEAEWSPLGQRERRSEPRNGEQGLWRVVHGLAPISEMLATSEPGFREHNQSPLSPEEILDIKLYGFVTERTREQLTQRARDNTLRALQDRWTQRDVSDHGLGFVLGPGNSEWAKVGKLLAIAPLDQAAWRLGIISRINRNDEDERLVGVQRITAEILPVTLKSDVADTALSYVVDEPEQPDQLSRALLLKHTGGNRETLILDSARYGHGRVVTLRSPQTANRIIRLEAARETGDAWLEVDFTVLAE